MKLNETNETTIKRIHLMTTTLCDRNCPHCCNKQMSMDDVPYVTDEELSKCEIVFLTGGEPIMYSQVGQIALKLQGSHKNIKKVIVYCNAYELWFMFSVEGDEFNLPYSVDGYTISIKNDKDVEAFRKIAKYFNKIEEEYGDTDVQNNTYVYVYDDLIKESDVPKGMKYFKREWQEDFVPNPDSIFRKI